jgi:hypothetical protein
MQKTQAVELVWPLLAPALPAGHNVQLWDEFPPTVDLKLPAGQSTQEACEASVYFPAGHTVQVVKWDEEIEPEAHWRHDKGSQLPVEGKKVPEKQGVGELEPAGQKCPAGHIQEEPIAGALLEQ